MSAFGEVVAAGDEARCEIVTRDELAGAPGRSGVVGAYRAANVAAGVRVLEAAVARLAGRDVRRVLGPMDGSTWMRYRLVLVRESESSDAMPPFAGEPTNPLEHEEAFRAAGFAPVARYESAITRAFAPDAERARVEAERARALEARGVRVRRLDPSRWDDELVRLHAASLEAFADNPYFSPIALDAFRALYEPMRPWVDPAFVEIAETEEGRTLGFMLSYVQPGTRVVIAKTIAVVPSARGTGLGALLFARAHAHAHDRGFEAVIHALMHADNVSRRMSERWGGRAFRRYALFGRTP